MIRWGKTSSGKVRYRCLACGSSRLYRASTARPDIFQLFVQYVLWGATYSQLSAVSGYSIRQLARWFHFRLAVPPPPLPIIDQSSQTEAFLLIDGLWFGRWFVLMVYRQSKNLTIMRISVMGKEVSTKIKKDLLWLRDHYRFTGIVSDGQTGIVKAVSEAYSHTPHQICLAHMHRDIVSAIGRKSADRHIRRLRHLADHVWLIESQEALRWWMTRVNAWYRANWEWLCETRKDADTGERWYIHKGARKAFALLTRLPATSFKFLDHPLMPKTTNELEAQFKHLGKRWSIHSGLKEERWENFLRWFVYLYNKDKLSKTTRSR